MRSNIQYPFKVTPTGIACVVCDCKVPNHEHNRNQHIRGSRHRDMVEHPFVKTATGVDCVVCNCQVPDNEWCKNEHIRGRSHSHMMDRATESVYEDQSTSEDCETNDSYEEDSEDDIQYPFKVTPRGVDCVVCDCKVPNHEQNRIEHVRGGRHRDKVEHPFEKAPTGLDCVVCNCRVPNNEWSRNEHIQGWPHRCKMNQAMMYP